jgi:hypothetical protein
MPALRSLDDFTASPGHPLHPLRVAAKDERSPRADISRHPGSELASENAEEFVVLAG